MKTSFDQYGLDGEDKIANFYRAQGRAVLHNHPDPRVSFSGPKLLLPSGCQLVLPDMLVLPDVCWVDGKRKAAWTWYRKTSQWQDGIDRHHHGDYLKVQQLTERPVMLLFLHLTPTPDQRDLDAGSPAQCPTGLFGCRVDEPWDHISGSDEPNGGKHGMVYWSIESLALFATLDELGDGT